MAEHRQPSISGDGKWVTYVLSPTNTAPADAKPVMHLLRLDNNQDLEIPNATAPAFSADSKWVAYQVDVSGGGRGGRGGRGGAGGGGAAAAVAPGAQNARGGTGATPTPPRRVELRNLATGAVQSWQDMQSFTFAATSSHIVLRRRAPGARRRAAAVAAARRAVAPGGAPAAAARLSRRRRAAPTSSSTISSPGAISCSAASARSSFNKKGDLLAYTVDATSRDGNGSSCSTCSSGRVNPLDNDARVYSRLTWNDDGTGLAVLKGVDVDKMRERDNMLARLSGRAGRARRRRSTSPAKLDPAKAAGFPKGFVRQRSRGARLERRQQARLLRR